MLAIVCLLSGFETIVDSQEVAKIIQKDPMYPSPNSHRGYVLPYNSKTKKPTLEKYYSFMPFYHTCIWFIFIIVTIF